MNRDTEQQLWNVLQEVKDPEIPTVSVVEMGMVNRILIQEEKIVIEMMPTFVGCPALDLIRELVVKQIHQQIGISQVEVKFVLTPPWTSDRITLAGQAKLKGFGIAPPSEEVMIVPPCPYCGASEGEVENLFGPTACRVIYYCKSCHQPFEGMKRI